MSYVINKIESTQKYYAETRDNSSIAYVDITAEDWRQHRTGSMSDVKNWQLGHTIQKLKPEH